MYGQGIMVNEHFQTSLQDIYAGGDICTIYCQRTGSWVQSCKWSDAVLQGIAAAHAMVGQSIIYKFPAITASSTFFKMKFVACGPLLFPPEGAREIIKKSDEFYHRFLVTSENILIGFLTLGIVENVAQLRNLVTHQLPLHD